MLTALLPFQQKAEAYGLINHEQVTDVGKNHFVVLKEDGSVWAWGDHSYGQLGSSATTSTSPKAVQKADGNRLLNITSIVAGGYHTAALDSEGNVWTWGRNTFGQLGHSSGSIKNENPEKALLPAIAGKIVAIAAGDYHTLAVDANGRVWAWGKNGYGQLGSTVGTGTPLATDAPTLVLGLTGIVAVAAGAEHSVALKSDGTVWAWGRNTTGQLGNGETTDVNYTPRMVPGLTNIMEIAAGDNHTLALKQDRTTIFAWGSNVYGQLGDGGREMKLTPIQIAGLTNIKNITAGANHSVAVREDGSVWTWGRHTSGTQSVRTTPIQLLGTSNVIAIGGGGNDNDSYTLAIQSDGTVWKWDKLSSDATKQLPILIKVSGIEGVMRLDEFPFVQGGQVLFRYIGNSTVSDVKVSGSFNNWVELPLERKSGNVWELQVELPTGEYEYGFKVNGSWVVDPLNRSKILDEFGRPLSLLTVVPYATETPIVNNKEVLFTYNSFDDSGMLELDAKTTSVAVVGSFNNWVEVPLVKQSNNIWSVTLSMEPGDYYYSFIVRDTLSGTVPEKRNDPLNPNRQTDALTNITRNVFRVSENLLTKVPVTAITLNKGPALDLIVGERESLLATISPSNATNQNINWTSSNPSIVSVDGGQLTAHSQGTAVVSAVTVDGGKIAMITITVKQQDNAVAYPRAGYEQFPSKTNVSSTKAWRIQFGGAVDVDLTSVNNNSVYIVNESGIKVPLGYRLLSDGKTVEIRLLDGFKYTAGATYYLFIEDTVKNMVGEQLKSKAQMKFQIAL